MARPTFGDVTEETYAALPELYRNSDAAQPDGPSNYPLLRYLAGILDQLDEVTDLMARFEAGSLDERGDKPGNEFGVTPPWERYGSGTYGAGMYGDSDADPADLVDPYYADGAWLPWLAQLVGIELDRSATLEAQRAAIVNASSTWAHATPGAVRAEVAKVLSGERFVEVVTAGNLPGDRFVAIIRTRRAETTSSATWGALQAQAPTWGDLNVLTFANAAAANIILAAEVERPVGTKFRHAYVD